MKSPRPTRAEARAAARRLGAISTPAKAAAAARNGALGGRPLKYDCDACGRKAGDRGHAAGCERRAG